MFSDTTTADVQVEEKKPKPETSNGTQDKAVNGKKRKAEDIVQKPQSDAPKKVKSTKTSNDSVVSSSKEEMEEDENPETAISKENVVAQLTQGIFFVDI